MQKPPAKSRDNYSCNYEVAAYFDRLKGEKGKIMIEGAGATPDGCSSGKKKGYWNALS